jgi:hypothetical protein
MNNSPPRETYFKSSVDESQYPSPYEGVKIPKS